MTWTLGRGSRGGLGAVPPAATVHLPGADFMYNPIPGSPTLDAESSAWTSLWNSGTIAKLDLYEFGVPVYEIPVGGSAPTYTVTADFYEPGRSITARIPDGAAPSPGSDGAMVVLDWDAGEVYEFWVAVKSGGVWSANTAAVFPIDGIGRGDGDTAHGTVGAGFSRSLGLLTKADLDNNWPDGDAGHALIFAVPFSQPTTVRYPATKTDGANTGGFPDTIPQAARLQLDPAYDVAGDGSMTTLEKFIARTLQTYGAYIMDNGGGQSPVVICQGDYAGDANPPTDPGDPTVVGGWARGYGATSDYHQLTNIPWGQLRWLATWNGA